MSDLSTFKLLLILNLDTKQLTNFVISKQLTLDTNKTLQSN